jgi:hypothetical protein
MARCHQWKTEAQFSERGDAGKGREPRLEILIHKGSETNLKGLPMTFIGELPSKE